MSRLDQLPPDQRAALQLLLRSQQSYAEVAETLGIAPHALHDRAHAALAAIAPSLARGVDHEMREQIGEYLLGQQSAEEADSTKIRMAASPPDREWARALAAELVHLTAEPLPAIPGAKGDHRPPAPPQAPRRRAPTPEPRRAPVAAGAAIASRRAGAALLAAIAVVAVVVIVLLTGGGESPKPSAAQQAASRTSTGKSSSQKTVGKTTIDSKMVLSAAESGSQAKGVAAVVTVHKHLGVLLLARGLAQPEGFFYVLWLVSSSGQTEPIGKTASVTKGELSAVQALPEDAGSFDRIELTRETNEHAEHPGTVVLSGPFKLHEKG